MDSFGVFYETFSRENRQSNTGPQDRFENSMKMNGGISVDINILIAKIQHFLMERFQIAKLVSRHILILRFSSSGFGFSSHQRIVTYH